MYNPITGATPTARLPITIISRGTQIHTPDNRDRTTTGIIHDHPTIIPTSKKLEMTNVEAHLEIFHRHNMFVADSNRDSFSFSGIFAK
jgi:hypothetical protein